MEKHMKIYSFLSLMLVALFMGACADNETAGDNPADLTAVEISIDGDASLYTRALGDATLSVNRILIMPFRKTNESLPDNASNYVPDYNAAKQINVSSFPVVATMLNLSPASTYQIMIIGYNQNDYDFANPNNASRTFNLAPSASPGTLASFYLQPVTPTVVPEFYTVMGTGYMKGAFVGSKFKPGQVNNVQGTLNRIVSGLSLDISNIPSVVTSISLVAEQLVTSTIGMDGSPLSWQTAGDSGVKLFGSKVPTGNKVSFNYFVLATLDAHKTLLFLDVTYGTFTERYTVKVPDIANTSSGNRIIFLPNHWIKISGDYTKINQGFVLTDNINLDDNIWDGIQPNL